MLTTAKRELGRLRHCGDGALTGLIVFTVQLIQATGFAALVFQGDLQAGIGIGLWAALAGIAIVGVATAWRTSSAPIGCSIDTPGTAVSAVLGASIGDIARSAGLTGTEAAELVLMALSLAAILGGLACYLLGRYGLAHSLRFIPFPVVAGFLGATGMLIALGGLKLVLDKPGSIIQAAAGLTTSETCRLGVALAFAILLRIGARKVRSPYLLPGALIAASIAIAASLSVTGHQAGWYLSAKTPVEAWFPFEALWRHPGRLRLLVEVLPEIVTLVVVMMISMVVKFATLELSRGHPVDLDREFEAHGIGNLAASLAGGIFSCLNMATTSLAQQAGAKGYSFAVMGGIAAAIFLLTGLNPASLVPTPVLGGLLILLGWGLLYEALWPPIAQKAWFETIIALAILLACLIEGHIVGVLIGLVVSCLIFAASYARIAVVRRHLTGDRLMGSAARPAHITQILRQHGASVHTFWLSGYLFFGSSEKVFDQVRAVIERPSGLPVRYIILDYSEVTGADASARTSIAKLKTFAERRGAAVVMSGMSADMVAAFRQAAILASSGQADHYADFTKALHWCEGDILARNTGCEPPADFSFTSWLASELGGQEAAETLLAFMVRQEVAAGQAIFVAGEPSESIAFVAAGAIEVRLTGLDGTTEIDRRMMGSTVIGEMGFFRRQPRGATVVAEVASVIYVLTRQRMHELDVGQPRLAVELCRFIIRELSGRLAFANDEAGILR